MIRQLTGLLDQLAPEDYRRPLPILGESTLGQHVRHIIDFYLSLLRDCSAGVVDYARRNRDPRLEQEQAVARAALNQIEDRIRELNEMAPLQVSTDFSDREGEERPLVASSVGRELMYAFDHALHHLAIIRIGFQSIHPEVTLDGKIGVAPSTIKYQTGQRKK